MHTICNQFAIYDNGEADVHHLICLPYLSLADTYTIGPWQILAKEDYQGPWPNAIVKKRIDQLFRHFSYPSHVKRPRPTIIVDAANGICSAAPNEVEGNALQTALDFSALHEDTINDSLLSITTDNTQMQCWPLFRSGYFAYEVGARSKSVYTGWNLSEHSWRIPYPMEIRLPTLSRVYLDEDLAHAVYEIAVNADSQNSQHRLITAIRWWSKSWRNSPSLSSQDRIVMMKTAFEALLGTSSSCKGAKELRRLFEDVNQQVPGGLIGLLWTSADVARHTHKYKIKGEPRTRQVTDLEHWFFAFADVRNKAIHQGVDCSDDYQELDSAYNGDILTVADRVFREAVRVRLEDFGYKELWSPNPGRLYSRHNESR